MCQRRGRRSGQRSANAVADGRPTFIRRPPTYCRRRLHVVPTSTLDLLEIGTTSCKCLIQRWHALLPTSARCRHDLAPFTRQLTAIVGQRRHCAGLLVGYWYFSQQCVWNFVHSDIFKLLNCCHEHTNELLSRTHINTGLVLTHMVSGVYGVVVSGSTFDKPICRMLLRP